MPDGDLKPPKFPSYQIRVKGLLDSSWSDWFDGLNIQTLENGVSLICGPVDQPALRGVLNKVWDLGLVVLSIQQVKGDKQDEFTSL